MHIVLLTNTRRLDTYLRRLGTPLMQLQYSISTSFYYEIAKFDTKYVKALILNFLMTASATVDIWFDGCSKPEMVDIVIYIIHI